MKKAILILATVLTLDSCGILGIGKDPQQLGQATAYALTAMSITDDQVAALSKEAVKEMDSKNVIESGRYKARLDRLMANVKDIEGRPVNYKVYKLDEVNAFACGDGSIRVYSGLMDVMDDAELMAIIGHECGHVVHQDTKTAMKSAYYAAAARGLISSSDGMLGALSKSVLGDLGEAFLSSQYSQKQEYKADEYGFQFAIDNGYSPYSMSNALDVLVGLAGGSQASLVQKMFSSHPGSQERAARMKTKAEQYSKAHGSGKENN